MNKKLVASLVATMAVGATAFAANPFVDVPSDSWAYNSVVELANSGIIQGVDGVHFQGERNITRYEAAEIVAKAMAHEDRANAEQRALINRLADEFSDELNNLGVRVSNLEDRVGNVKLTGDARIRYMKQGQTLKNDDSWQFRGRLRANAKINDRADAVLGMEYNSKFANDTAASASASSAGKDHFYVDRAYVNYALDNGHKWNVMVGRYDYELGNNMGLLYGNNFDGAQIKFANGKFAATAGYGKFKEGAEASGPVVANSAATPPVTAKDAEIGLLNGKTAYGELEAFFGGGTVAGSAIGVYYNNINSSVKENNADVWGAYTSLNFAKKFNLNVEAYRINYDKEVGKLLSNADAFSAKLTYGKAKFDTPKSWDLWVNYINIEDGAADDNGTGSWRTNVNNTKGWAAGADYTFAKNAQFQVFQTFDSKAKSTHKDRDELTRAQFVFVF